MLRDTLVKMRVPQALDAASRYYFQLDILGKENLALLRDQQAMLVMNHTAFFALECYLLGSNLLTTFPDLNIRTLVWKGFSEGPARAWFKNIGCETASIKNGQTLLDEGKSILIMPEGVDATDVRNRLNTFHTGYLRMLQNKTVPIIPIGFHGIDQSIPWIVAHNETLEKRLMKPVNPNFDFLLIPKLPIFRPTKVVFKIGKPIYPDSYDISNEEALNRTNQQVKTIVSELVDDAEQARKEKISQNRYNRIFHRLVEGNTSQLRRR